MARTKIKPFLRGLCVLGLWGCAIMQICTHTLNAANALDLTALLLLTLLAKLFLPLDVLSCLMLCPLLMIESSLCHYLIYLPMLVLLFLLDVGLILFWQHGQAHTYFLGMSAAGIAAAFLLLAYRLLSRKFMPVYYFYGRLLALDTWQRAAIIGAFGLLCLCFYVDILHLLGKLLNHWKEQFRPIYQRFRELEFFVLMLVVLSIITWEVYENIALLANLTSAPKAHWFRGITLTIIPLLILFMDVIYIILLMKAASIKEKMYIAQNDKNLVSAYNTELETTMDSLHEIRHDAKNLLLTMGSFVSRSDDAQMKEFYRQNIVPFMESALRKNELQDKLKILQDDCVKSFLYYKIIEKNGQGIPVHLELSASLSLGAGYGDIIRLLGILIDNAAEECSLIDGQIRLDTVEDTQGVYIRVTNPVRPETRTKGVVPGTTDKGLGRGQGLLIARKIISRYRNLQLNSYFTDDGFVQSLLIAKG